MFTRLSILPVLALLLATQASATCTVEQIAGTYPSQFGTIDCKAQGGVLNCCYEDVQACNKQLRLTLNPNGREVNGQWLERGQSGPAKFVVTPQCDLMAGRWGSGPRPTARWSVDPRTSPRPVVAKATKSAQSMQAQTNFKGELLYQGDDFSIFQLVTSKSSPGSWCSNLQFQVSAEYTRDASALFSPNVIYTELFSSLLPELRLKHCPQATTNITASIYLKDIYFNARGERKTPQEAAQDGRTANSALASISFYTDFKADPNARPSDASRLNFIYRDNGVHRMRLPNSEVANLVGSANLLLAYWQRGGKAPDEHAEVERRKTAVRARFDALAARYGAKLTSYDTVRILGGHGNELKWSRDDSWFFLRSYIQTTSAICGENTVGEPYRNQTRVVDNAGRTIDDAVVLWYSKALHPRVTGQQIGTGLGGVYRPDVKIKADIEALIQVNGCASEPLAIIERFFH